MQEGPADIFKAASDQQSPLGESKLLRAKIRPYSFGFPEDVQFVHSALVHNNLEKQAAKNDV